MTARDFHVETYGDPPDPETFATTASDLAMLALTTEERADEYAVGLGVEPVDHHEARALWRAAETYARAAQSDALLAMGVR